MLNYRTKQILINLGAYILVLIPAYFGNKIIEVTISIIIFSLLRNCFPKTYHADTIEKDPNKAIKLCILNSITLFCLIQPLLIKINASILVSAFVGIIIAYVSYLLEDYLELRNKECDKDNKNKRDIIIDLLDNNVSLEYITNFCKNKGLKENIAKTVNLYLNNTLQETSDQLYVDLSTVKRRIDKFIETAK